MNLCYGEGHLSYLSTCSWKSRARLNAVLGVSTYIGEPSRTMIQVQGRLASLHGHPPAQSEHQHNFKGKSMLAQKFPTFSAWNKILFRTPIALLQVEKGPQHTICLYLLPPKFPGVDMVFPAPCQEHLQI